MADDPKTSLPRPVKSTEFSPEHWTALDLSDTIAVPSASQAPGRLYFGVRYLSKADDVDLEPLFYFKVVEVVHEREMVARTFDEESVKAIRYRAPAGVTGEPATPGWTLKTSRQLRPDLVKLRALLEKEAEREAKAVAKTGEKPVKVSHEVLLHEFARLYVPSAAPVLLRRDHGLTAAEAEEICAFPSPGCNC